MLYMMKLLKNKIIGFLGISIIFFRPYFAFPSNIVSVLKGDKCLREKFTSYLNDIQNNPVGAVLLSRLSELFQQYQEKYPESDPHIVVVEGDHTQFTPSAVTDSPPNYSIKIQELVEDRSNNTSAVVRLREIEKEKEDCPLEMFESLCKESNDLKQEIKKRLQKEGAGKNRNLIIEVNFEDSILIAAAVNQMISISGQKIIPIGYVSSDIFAMIVHEFIHMKHFLEEEMELSTTCSYSTAKDITSGDHDATKNLPEIKEKRGIIPWTNFEERRTVCGPDQDGLTELSYLISAKLPNRYLYLSGEQCFYESFDTYQAIVNNVCNEWNSKRPKSLIRIDLATFWKDVSFDRAKIAKDYTPYDICSMEGFPSFDVASKSFIDSKE